MIATFLKLVKKIVLIIKFIKKLFIILTFEPKIWFLIFWLLIFIKHFKLLGQIVIDLFCQVQY